MTTISFHDDRVILHQGNCLDVLDTLAPNSLDGCVCDPPYHLASIVKRFGADGAAPAKHGTDGAFARAGRGFMGKQWDGGDIAFQVETWAKVIRVLKPGAYIVAFSSSRTFGRMSVAIEDAGFITHPMIGWLFGSGFPKATRIKAEGYEGQRYGGQALKPALEPIYVGQKPFSEETGTANILKWGTGAVNIDGCRVDGIGNKTFDRTAGDRSRENYRTGTAVSGSQRPTDLGRWPANLVHDGSPEVLAGFPETTSTLPGNIKPSASTASTFGVYTERSLVGHTDSGSAAPVFLSGEGRFRRSPKLSASHG